MTCSRILKCFSKAMTFCALSSTSAILLAQSAATGSVLPVGAEWATYNGDYSGKRFSSLTQINNGNVGSLTLAWAFQTHASSLKSTPLMVNGIVYFNVPDHTWAVDAKTGARIWEFARPSQGDHVGGRGVAFFRNRIYVGTPDAHLICLDARNGTKIWDVTVADVAFGYYIGLAPLVVGDKVLVGTSGDSADVPHRLYALDWETGKQVWTRSSLPLAGEPGAETWPDAKAMAHGGGPMWLTGTYDPDLGLIYWGSGNPHPVLAGDRRKGDDLYTCSILALHADTGKMAWYFQASPHDTHDWDAVETPVLFDAQVEGHTRKLLAQASRNGFYFVLDRVTGKNIASKEFIPGNWAAGVDSRGQPIPKPEKEPRQDGSLLHSVNIGGTSWMAPSLDPQTGLFYVSALEGYASGTSWWTSRVCLKITRVAAPFH